MMSSIRMYSLIALGILTFIINLPATQSADVEPFVSQPRAQPYYVKEGQQSELITCGIKAEYMRTPGYKLKWTKVVNQRPRDVTEDDTTYRPEHYALATTGASGTYNLRISNVTYVDDNGVFYCQWINNTHTIDSQPAVVIVLVRPKNVRITQEPGTPVSEGQTLRSTCESVGGNPAPKLEWQFSNRTAVPAEWATVLNATDLQTPTKSTLRWTAVAEQNADYLICTAWNEALRDETETLEAQTRKVTVRYRPRVTIGPTPELNVEVGDTATMNCAARGNPDQFTYRWEHTATRRLNGSLPLQQPLLPRATLQVEVRKSSAGLYACAVSNTEGEGSAQLRLNVFYRPEVHVQADSLTITEGESLRLSCSVDANPAASLIEWIAPDGSRHEGPTWNIPNVQRAQRGNYTCRAQNTLTVFQKKPEQRQSERSILVQVGYPPGRARVSVSSSQVLETENVTLSCAAEDVGYPPAQYQFSRDGINLPTTYDSITLYNVRMSEAGSYTCVAVNAHGTGQADVFKLRVLAPAKLITYLQTEAGPYNEGDPSLQLICRAMGNPRPIFNWLQNGLDVQMSDKWTINNQLTDECSDPLKCVYTVTSTLRGSGPVVWDDHGEFTCRTSNHVGQIDESSGIVRVRHYPRVVNTPGQSLSAAQLGRTAQLKCIASALPEADFRWFRTGSNTEITNGGVKYSMSKEHYAGQDITVGTLRIENVQAGDYGQYDCLPRNSMQQANRTALTLTTISPPTLPETPIVTSKSYDHLFITWQPGFNGGKQQIFLLEVGARRKFEVYTPLDAVTGQPISELSNRVTVPGIEGDELNGNSANRRTVRYLGSSSASPGASYNASNLQPLTTYSIRLLAQNDMGNTTWTDFTYAHTDKLPVNLAIDPPTETRFILDDKTLTYKKTSASLGYCMMILVNRDNEKHNYGCLANSAEADSALGKINLLPQVSSLSVAFCERQQSKPVVCSNTVDVAAVVPAGSSILDTFIPIIIVAACLVALCAGQLLFFITLLFSSTSLAPRAAVISQPFASGTSPRTDESKLSAADSGMFTMDSHKYNTNGNALTYNANAHAYSNAAMRSSYDDPAVHQHQHQHEPNRANTQQTLDRWSPHQEPANAHNTPYEGGMDMGMGYGDLGYASAAAMDIVYYDQYGQPVDMQPDGLMPPFVDMPDDNSSAYSVGNGAGRRVMQEIVV